MSNQKASLTMDEVRHRRALKLEFTAGFFIGIAEGVFFCWLAGML